MGEGRGKSRFLAEQGAPNAGLHDLGLNRQSLSRAPLPQCFQTVFAHIAITGQKRGKRDCHLIFSFASVAASKLGAVN